MVLAVAACIPPRPSPTPPSATPSASPPPATASPAGSPASGGVIVDPALLDVLPTDIQGTALAPDPDSAADIAADGSVAPFVSAIALAAAFGPAATDTPLDYVIATVSRLRPGTFSEVFFRGWRDTFDAAVCEQAGGVSGNAEAEIGGRRTFIGSCAGGVRTYHAYLEGRDVIVSAHSAGAARYGEQLMAGLTE
jgi:hypothetical protein